MLIVSPMCSWRKIWGIETSSLFLIFYVVEEVKRIAVYREVHWTQWYGINMFGYKKRRQWNTNKPSVEKRAELYTMLSISYWQKSMEISNIVNLPLSFQFYQLWLHILWSTIIRCIYIYDFCIFLLILFIIIKFSSSDPLNFMILGFLLIASKIA